MLGCTSVGAFSVPNFDISTSSPGTTNLRVPFASAERILVMSFGKTPTVSGVLEI